MSFNLFELNDELRQLIVDVEVQGGNMTAEQDKRFNINESDLGDKLADYKRAIIMLEEQSAICLEEIKRLRAAMKVRDILVKRLKQALYDAVFDFDMASDVDLSIVGLIKRDDGLEVNAAYNTKGKYYGIEGPNDYDLMMAPKKQEIWIFLYRDRNDDIKISPIYYTKKGAENMLNDWCERYKITPIGVKQITWEE